MTDIDQNHAPQFLTLDVRGYKEDTSEADPDDQWSVADTSTSWDVRGIKLSDKDGGEHSIRADFPVKSGDYVYVVYAVYSTGDSFHNARGEYFELISMHRNQTVATRNRESVNRARPNDEGRHSMTIEFDSGGKVTRYCPWDGYFESLDYVTIEAFMVP
jgi:hypothetical protein